mmetsp:Transcript_47310/g.87885  ORF Transcript_47310/g.87885 Transcript_47310/m.87885 type:complete len:337 (-) Transcript_47310:666-1676(-)
MIFSTLALLAVTGIIGLVGVVGTDAVTGIVDARRIHREINESTDDSNHKVEERIGSSVTQRDPKGALITGSVKRALSGSDSSQHGSGSSSKSTGFPGEEDYCPTGEEACCGLSFVECRNLVFLFQIFFQKDVIGDAKWDERKKSPIIPINAILDKSVRDESVGEYSASTIPTPKGKSKKKKSKGNDNDAILFKFRIDDIIKSSDEIIDDLPTNSSVFTEILPAITEYGIKITLFNGAVEDNPFIGLVVSFINPRKKNKFEGFLYVFDEPAPSQDTTRSRELQEVSCSSAFDAAQGAYLCPNAGDELEVHPACRIALILACEGAVAAANGDLETAIK